MSTPVEGLEALLTLCSPGPFENYVRRYFKAFPASTLIDIEQQNCDAQMNGELCIKHWDREPVPPIPKDVVMETVTVVVYVLARLN